MSDDSGSSEPRWHSAALYSVGMQQARQSGDLQRMREVAERARAEKSDDPEFQSALRELEAEIARLSGS
jgi:hypothetical protein